jgi:hypothetical protein
MARDRKMTRVKTRTKAKAWSSRCPHTLPKSKVRSNSITALTAAAICLTQRGTSWWFLPSVTRITTIEGQGSLIISCACQKEDLHISTTWNGIVLTESTYHQPSLLINFTPLGSPIASLHSWRSLIKPCAMFVQSRVSIVKGFCCSGMQCKTI